MELKDIIKSQRIKYNLTLKEVADICGVSEATISRWETGNINDMRRGKIVALAKALHISPLEILGWNESDDLHDYVSDYIKENYIDELLSVIKGYVSAPKPMQEAILRLLDINQPK